jgi:opacity protein-like surface antigen
MRNIIVSMLVFALLAAPMASAQAPAPAQPPAEAASWRSVALATPLGARVKVETFEGRRYSGTLMQVTDDAVVIKRATRIPEPPATIPFDQVARLEQDRGGVGVGKAIGIGLAAGAGAMLSLILMAFAFGGD